MDQDGLGPPQKKLQRGRCTVAFLDESGFTPTPLVRKTWSRCGETPVLVHSHRARERVNAISAVTSARKLYFRFKRDGSRDKGINGLDVVAFIQNLLRHTRGLLVVVCDNARQHHSRVMKDFLRRRRRLKVVYLPGYSPDFNPDEGVWGWVKWRELGNFAARDEAELMAAARGALRRLQRRTSTIAGFWRHTLLPLDGLTMLHNKPDND